jgi:hypothetical protein
MSKYACYFKYSHAFIKHFLFLMPLFMLTTPLYASIYDDLLVLTNAERQKQGLTPLSLSTQLGTAAQLHAEDMAQYNFMSHTGSNGSTMVDRVVATGYSYLTLGENVAAGQTSAASVINAWMNSEGHRANILNPNFTEIGFGYAYVNTGYQHYWVQVFGKPTTSSGTNPTPITSTLTWHTSKTQALALATQENKKLILVAGRDTCGNTTYMRFTLFEKETIRTLLANNYILWYSDVDTSSDWYTYASGLGSFALPLIAIIDPANSSSYLERSTDIQTEANIQTLLEKWKISTQPTPTEPTTALLTNLAARAYVFANKPMYGAFIVSDAATDVILVGNGPSLSSLGISNYLADPVLEVYNASGVLIYSNNNWEEDSVSATKLRTAGRAPTYSNEPALYLTLNSGYYTFMLKGYNGSEGEAVLNIYRRPSGRLTNLAARSYIANNGPMYGAFMINGASTNIVLVGSGPSLSNLGINNALSDPLMEVYDAQGNLMQANNNWEENASSATQLRSINMAPSFSAEPALYMTLNPGYYTFIVKGAQSSQGEAVINIYQR